MARSNDPFAITILSQGVSPVAETVEVASSSETCSRISDSLGSWSGFGDCDPDEGPSDIETFERYSVEHVSFSVAVQLAIRTLEGSVIGV